MLEIAQRLCTSPERVQLFRGLIDLRRALVRLGITEGVQWIDGSYCEDVERLRGRPPGDIDIVTFFLRPAAYRGAEEWRAFVQAHLDVFHKAETKRIYGCEAFYVDATLPPGNVVTQTAYWYGLFTHQKETNLWKGILSVPLVADDDDALAYVERLRFAA